MADKEKLKHLDGIAQVRGQVDQSVLRTAIQRLGPEATAVDGYVDNITDIMLTSGITVQDAREALDGVEGPHLLEVYQALMIIEKRNQADL